MRQHLLLANIDRLLEQVWTLEQANELERSIATVLADIADNDQICAYVGQAV